MRFILAFMAILALPVLATSATIIVPDDYATIQGAINASANGDVILVKPGSYVENLNFTGKDITLRSDQDLLVGTEDIAPDTTIIDGNQYTATVAFTTSETSAAVLKGFTIRNGIGFNNGADRLGGGVFCFNASPTVCNNVITQNTASFGAGLCAEGSTANPVVTENTFVLNNASKTGGAIQCNQASPMISHNTIAFNVAGNAGGAIDVYQFCTPTIFNNIIKKNQADDGGGIECYSANPNIVNNIIKDNVAESGAGVYCYASAPNMTNNTFFQNNATIQGGALHCYWYSFPVVTNCILWNDTAPLGLEEISADPTSLPAVNNSDVEGGYPGTNNINADPLFLSPASNPSNLHIGLGSPCIDIGDNLAPGIGSTDFNHEPRVENLLVDIGVDEFYPYPALELHVPSQYLTIQDAINAAPSGATVYVAPKFQNEGFYVENLDFIGKDITVVSDKDSNPLTHDISPIDTVVDGNSQGAVVVFENGETATSVIDGFTIRGGSGELFNFNRHGGGIFCNQSSPIIINNVIIENDAAFGGGIHCEDCAPTIENNTIEVNDATHSGGGIMGTRSNAVIDKNIFKGNTAAYTGGAISMFQYCSPDITNNLIYDNMADFGGAIGCYWAAPNISNNTIVDNTGNNGGGAFFCEFNSRAVINNCILWNNVAPSGPELFTQGYSTLVIDFCNVKNGSLSAYTSPDSTMTFGLPFVTYSINMIEDDPGFVDAANDNLRLAAGSPCINRGTNTTSPADDIEGTARPNVGLADIGAYEFTGTHELTADMYTMSAAAGGTMNLALDAGVTYSSRNYHLLASIFGSAPGVPLNASTTLPLNIFFASLGVTDPVFSMIIPPSGGMGIFNNFYEQTFDGFGTGSAQAVFPAGFITPEQVGSIVYFAFCTRGPYDHASNVIALEFIP